ncbi:RsmE family RNA methyltransferase [Flavitalea sp. BT771]|uniref:RsmE family RNA methyltransferase n=1 Tax=Flavitalea sp. BT771 TaxID=3063329 RepID=UPI0026E1144C|nr:RsmE family RNA methyltransferase [Flavitalea sp. BT771]MDO6435565.1 RsmE family RNA methyltransferase [Flavitalea sp. BT771]MDV6224465.1 RsmE family RNA methyltransferase [Flavitalea sp. BT771]
MALPFFYLSAYRPGDVEITLDEDNSRHVVQVLRMQKGQQLLLTDGSGWLLTAAILDDHKKKCLVRVNASVFQPGRTRKVTVAMSLLKNASRFEWFLEKATEIGVTGIVPLLCERTEKQHFRQDRMQNILVSAMLQSQQTWLPALRTPTPLAQVIRESSGEEGFIAHCVETERSSLAVAARASAAASQLILIGPEGDFTKNEIEMALGSGLLPVTLGETRLRTETAGVVAATLMCIR